MSDIIENDQPPEPDDERDPGTPEPKPAIIDVAPNPQPPEEGPRALTTAASQVPVKPHGAAPENFGHQITLAQYMAKATLMVPEHFHGNVGDCLAIIDIAQRAGLSPYMVAAKTYKAPNGKGIAFESQLYHAMLIGSGWIRDSALHVKYDGTGDDRTCTVWGTLRNETEPRYYTSPPLKDVKPGKNASGQIKGSPLWADKPDVQQFYDTSRDWSRIFAPISTLGMLAQYEAIEHPVGAMKVIEPNGLIDKLKTANREEGHKAGHADNELNNIAADKGTIEPGEGEPTTIKPAEDGNASKTKPKASAKTKPEPPKAAPKSRAGRAPTPAAVKAAADRAEARSERTKAQATDTPPKPAVPSKPSNPAEYQVYAMDWINRSGDPEKALSRWSGESDMRDDLSVPIKTRNALREQLEKKHGV